MSDSSTILSTPAPITSHLNTTVAVFAVIFPFSFFWFDVVLLLATIKNRGDTSYPLGYIAAMCISGAISTLSMTAHYFIYLVLSDESYSEYLEHYGREITVIGTFAYLNSLLISVLMTVNRVIVVLKPFRSNWFSHKNVLCFCTIIAAIVLVSLIIPYSTPCAITFLPAQYSFISGCAPNRHPITQFQNTYAIVLPFSCMFINLGLIIHLRFVRNGTYSQFKQCLQKMSLPEDNPPVSLTLSKSQARRDFIMMRQTVSVAVYLSVYEFGALLLRTFPDAYASLPPTVREVFFYIRLESVAIMNFFIYYVQTESTRRMLRRCLGLKESSGNSGPLATMVATNQRNFQNNSQNVQRNQSRRITSAAPVVA